MRIERLEVGGFGRLADLTLDFGPRVTILLGVNESGKSTVHRALRAALFGIDAGGPGRPTDRSDWARWAPWSASAPYSLALTYALADGRRVRVARRLEQRAQSCQVHEIGGGDITDAVRVGRAVSPGQVHLGIDETVFCASACIGDDALRIGATDSPAARAAQVQEAIERLADSGSMTTATEALLALEQAARRVGSERRLQSPLGQAVNRLRQLDIQIEEARRRFHQLAAEEERLRSLEADAVRAEARRAGAERRWLVGRLAALAAQRTEVEAGSAEMVRLAAEVEGNAHLVTFPIEHEDRVIVLGAEAQEARRSSDEAAARALGAATPLAEVRRRRAEIAAGLAALGEPADLAGGDLAAFAQVREDLAEVLAGRHRQEMAAAAARRAALRREVAGTGLTTTAPAAVDAAIQAVARTRDGGHRRWLRRLGGVVLVGAAVAVALATAVGRPLVAAVAGVTGALGAVAALLADRAFGGDAERARRTLIVLCPGASLDPEGLERLAERLPRLRALYHELEREEVRIEALSIDAEGTDRRLAELAAHAEAMAGEAGVTVEATGGTTPDGAEMRIRAVLAAVDGTAGIHGRRLELQTEDLLLRQREADLERVATESAERAAAAVAVEQRLRHILDRAGIGADVPLGAAVVAFRAACAGRARHDAASRRLEELRRRALIAGDPGSLERHRSQLEQQLAARGGDLSEVEVARPLGQAELQELESEAEHARQSAVVAVTAAASLRARLGEMRRGQPALADLEDERAACRAARDRGRRQLEALRRAGELIEEATRGVHRDLAPRLADSVAERLALLTDARYSAVNVDTAHFEVSLLGGDRPDLVPLDLVSHGTRDQVSLLLRLALAEVLSGGGEPVPLLLDEPLLSADPQRRRTALRFLWSLSARNQVILSASDPTLAAALAECADGAQPSVIEMTSPAAGMEAIGRPVAVVRAL